jgi:hypothetical protein
VIIVLAYIVIGPPVLVYEVLRQGWNFFWNDFATPVWTWYWATFVPWLWETFVTTPWNWWWLTVVPWFWENFVTIPWNWWWNEVVPWFWNNFWWPWDNLGLPALAWLAKNITQLIESFLHYVIVTPM